MIFFCSKRHVKNIKSSRWDIILQPKLQTIEPIKDYRLRLPYETGKVKLFDVTPYIVGIWYGELKDTAYFKTVQLVPGGIGIEWANGQDIAPHEIYEQSSVEMREG